MSRVYYKAAVKYNDSRRRIQKRCCFPFGLRKITSCENVGHDHCLLLSLRVSHLRQRSRGQRPCLTKQCRAEQSRGLLCCTQCEKDCRMHLVSLSNVSVSHTYTLTIYIVKTSHFFTPSRGERATLADMLHLLTIPETYKLLLISRLASQASQA